LSSTYKQIEYLNIRELSMHKSEYPPNDSGAEFVRNSIINIGCIF
jgi:hypothetical protein